MTRLQVAFLLSTAAALVACVPLSRAQDTVTTHTVKMIMVQADLTKTLDAGKTKVGDPVTVKLVYEANFSDGTTLPRNTALTGHVDRVQASEKKSDSLIQITLDKALLKGGKVIPIKATIMKLHVLVSPFASIQGGDSGTSLNPDSAAPRAQTGQTAGINRVTLQSDVEQPYSAIFQSSRRNARLSGGTEMDIAVGELPAKAPAQ
jgi:hypothetical protein